MTPTVIDPLSERDPSPPSPRARWEDLAYVDSGGWRIAYQCCGEPGAPVIALVMGLGAQMTAWPDVFCLALADQGFRVVRIDNRDIGKSSRGQVRPSILLHVLAAGVGWPMSPPYTLREMAADVIAVLDRLGAARVHVAGVSMGGMIAQHLAASWPQRVSSLVALMTSSGRPGLPGPSAEMRRFLLQRPDPNNRAAWIDNRFWLLKAINSPGYPDPDEALLTIAEASYDRGRPHGPGTARQLAAILADGSRVKLLGGLQLPTLVIHGPEDPLIPLPCGLDVAKAAPGAEALVLKGLGHHIPLAISHFLALRIASFCADNTVASG